MEELIKINYDKCIGCGRCLYGCSARIFQFDTPGSWPRIDAEADQRCIQCGHCVCICPNQAISVGMVTPESSAPVNRDKAATFDSFAELVRIRRSNRHYDSRPLAQADLDRLFDLVRWAPTAKNRLQLKWLVINDSAKVHQAAKLVIDGIRGDEQTARMVEAWDNGYDWILRGAPCVVVAYTEESLPWTPIDATIAIETMDLGAAALGIGSCWAGFLMHYLHVNPELRKLFGLKPENAVGAALMLGYLDNEQYTLIPWRPQCDVRYL